MNIETLYQCFLTHPNIQIDSRKITVGDIFFALKGPNFNGNNFITQALAAGAACVIADEPQANHDERVFIVDDVLKCLQDLAKHHRDQFIESGIPVIAITGSNGKTTTKELIHEVLSSSYITYTTKGNLNNHIGIPLSILRIKKDAEFAVIEMGANHLHEIAGYCEYVNPTHGMITNCGKAHLEGFGGIENIRKGKGELYDHLRKNIGTVFVNSDDKVLLNMATGIEKVVTYGSRDAFVTGRILKGKTFLSTEIFGEDTITINTQLVGDYNFYNVMAAVAIGKYFNIPMAKIKSALENYVPSNSRSQLIKMDSNTIIMDAYNANPDSMRVAIENLAALNTSDKVLLLGDMMELGEDSKAEHEAIIALIDKHQWKDVVLVGEQFKQLQHNYTSLNISLEAAEWLKQKHFQNVTMLIKGSRSIEMEKVIPA